MNWTKEHRHQPTSSEQTLAQRREHPYIWATWLPRLLTGENSCEWAVWFKAHYQDWTKVPSDFNQAQWILNHTALLNKRKAEWNRAIAFSKTMGVGEPDSVPAQRQPPSIFAGHDVFNLSNRKFRRWLLPPNENAIALQTGSTVALM